MSNEYAIQRFACFTTENLELALENRTLGHENRAQIEFALMARPPRCYQYGRQSKFTGSDGSTLSFGTKSKPFDLAKVMEAENAYIEHLMAKPLNVPDDSLVKKWINNQTAIIRKVVPGLIAMDLTAVQPMSAHVSVLPSMFKTLIAERALAFPDPTYFDAEAVIRADKDLQQIGAPSWMKGQEIGRGLRDLPGNLCMEVPMTACNDYLDRERSTAAKDVWEELRKMTSTMNVPIITATAPEHPPASIMTSMASGIYPDRRIFFQDFFEGHMSSYKRAKETDITFQIHADRSAITSAPVEMMVTKVRDHGDSEKVEFDISKTKLWGNWAAESSTKRDATAETLAILGIGEAQ